MRQTNLVWVLFTVCSAILKLPETAKYLSNQNNFYFLSLQKKLSIIDDTKNIRYFSYLLMQFHFYFYQFCSLLQFIFIYFSVLLRRFTSFFILFIIFLYIVAENGGVAMGDKSAHEISFHIPQIFYFVLFYCSFYPFNTVKLIYLSFFHINYNDNDNDNEEDENEESDDEKNYSHYFSSSVKNDRFRKISEKEIQIKYNNFEKYFDEACDSNFKITSTYREKNSSSLLSPDKNKNNNTNNKNKNNYKSNKNNNNNNNNNNNKYKDKNIINNNKRVEKEQIFFSEISDETSRKFRGNIFLTKFLILTFFSLISMIIVYFLTYEHEYLLADNRHYMFYIWKNFYRNFPLFRYLIVPVYVYLIQLIFKYELSSQITLFKIIFLLAIAASLVPSRLLEFRYFIIPMILTRLHSNSLYVFKKNTPLDRVCYLADLFFQIILNLFVFNIYFYHPFGYYQNSRFMF